MMMMMMMVARMKTWRLSHLISSQPALCPHRARSLDSISSNIVETSEDWKALWANLHARQGWVSMWGRQVQILAPPGKYLDRNIKLQPLTQYQEPNIRTQTHLRFQKSRCWCFAYIISCPSWEFNPQWIPIIIIMMKNAKQNCCEAREVETVEPRGRNVGISVPATCVQ